MIKFKNIYALISISLLLFSQYLIADEIDFTVSRKEGGGLVVTNTRASIERVRMNENGIVYIYGLPTAETEDNPICYDSSTGQLGNCDAGTLVGPIGPAGPPGEDGAPGTDGMNGTPGADGMDGAPGADGMDGAPGADGMDGAPGADGMDGAPGADGMDGAPGADGMDGAPGTDGMDGAPGADGMDGAPGADGMDGIPGPPGPSGGNITVTLANSNITLNTDNQFVLASGNNALTITLPASPISGQVLYFYAEFPGNISLDPNGKDFRQNGVDYDVSLISEFGNINTEALTLIYSGTKWYPIAIQ